jgi:hypothetical protein
MKSERIRVKFGVKYDKIVVLPLHDRRFDLGCFQCFDLLKYAH